MEIGEGGGGGGCGRDGYYIRGKFSWLVYVVIIEG